jgi:hypothetical protein
VGSELKKLISENSGLEKELSSHPCLKNSPLNIRDALYGGRTEATKTYYKIQQGEKLTMRM